MAAGPPQTIGPYRILGPLGAGAMGEVSLASRSLEGGFRKIYALKVVRLDGEARGALPRLLNEAVTGATFNHPNLVQIHDYGISDPPGGPRLGYVVMDYVEGITFRALIEARARGRAPLPLPVVLDLILPVASALSYAWEEARDAVGRPVRMIHRDIKPTNLMVTRHGVVKLLDLGLVRASTNPAPSLVQSIKGTVPYMSPEQAANASLDGRSDLFSLGAVAFELATLERLYPASGEALLPQVRAADVGPRIRALHEASPALAQVLRRALAREPGERYPTPGALYDALAALRGRVGSGPPLADVVRPLMAELAPTEEALTPARPGGGGFEAAPTERLQRRAPGAPPPEPLRAEGTEELAAQTGEVSLEPLRAEGGAALAGNAGDASPAPAAVGLRGGIPWAAVAVVAAVAALVAWALSRGP